MQNIIEIENLWWKYKESRDWVLKGIDLFVRKGEFLAITGPSGAGKSTLCLCMNGIIPHILPGEISENGVRVKGTNTLAVEPSELVKNVGIVFQDPETQFVTMCVEDEVAFALENYGVPRSEMITRVNEALSLVRLEDLRLKYPFELSGGQKQRVAIAKFLALRPEILVLDEPTSDLDPVGKEEVFQTISNLRKETGMTLIVVEHSTEELAKYADKLILLYDGKIIRSGTPKEFFQDVDFLRERGVYSPQVTEFAARLSRLGYVDTLPLPITLNESIPYLEKTFSKWLRKLSPTQTTVQRQSPQQDGETIISVKDLHFAYPDGTVALRGVDLDIHSGEYVAIIGQNGSGKTTLVKHFGGLLKPTSGSVKLEGQETKDLHMTEVISKVGYVYQNPDHQIFCNTVLEECAFAPAHLGLPPDEVESRAKEAIEAVGLKGLENEQPFFLGKGQRQNLAVGSILAMRPKILIVDEPTTGQDMRRTDAMMSLIDKLNSLGRTIIIITHNMRIVAEHAKRTVVMTQGRISLDANTDEIFSHPEKLSGTFLKPPQITELAERFKLYAFSEGTLTVEQMTRSFIDLTMKPQEVDRVARTP